MSLSVWLSAMSEMTSDSAKTVHMLEMVSSPYPTLARAAHLVHVQFQRPRHHFQKMSVPAAHLSFMTKLLTRPPSERQMTLLSCPPISTMVRAEGFRSVPLG